MVCAAENTKLFDFFREENMHSFKPLAMVLSTFLVLSIGVFLVPKPTFGARLAPISDLEPQVSNSICIPNDTQWICP
jgi:hypothetical protein